ncbi:MAG TPA: hypothetical protein PLJ98_02805 [Acholeplasmataceae bacterium]|nr:hypothetical protein [Acholeplasmataceae bacterium]HRX44706.1 hypothetical protein [Acholeplasmataceae bacterium]
MVLNVFTQALTLGIPVAIVFGITYLINLWLVKKKKWYVFILPVIFFVIGIMFWALGLVADDWGAIGFMIYGVLSALLAVGSLLSALLVYFKKANES